MFPIFASAILWNEAKIRMWKAREFFVNMGNSEINFNDFLLDSEFDVYKLLLKDISTCKETQMKWRDVIMDIKKIKEFEIILKIIEQNFEKEINENNKGIAYHLVGLLMHSLSKYELWEKMIFIIGSSKHKSVKTALNYAFGINCIFKRIMETIGIYLKALDGINDEYFVNPERIPENSEKQFLD